MKPTPTQQTLALFADVATRGPVTLKQLSALRPEFSRMAIWRTLDALRDAGWVRMRRGDNAWLATHAADDVLGNTTIPPRAVEELAAKLQDIPERRELHIAAFTEMGRLEIIESSDPTRIGEILPLVGEPMAYAALAISEEADMLRHLKRWMNIPPDQGGADAEERALITSGGITEGLRTARANPRLEMESGTALPHRAADGSVAVAWIGA